jgi:hypothetical protein
VEESPEKPLETAVPDVAAVKPHFAHGPVMGMNSGLHRRFQAAKAFRKQLKTMPSNDLLKARRIIGLLDLWYALHVPTEQITSVVDLADSIFEDPALTKEWLEEANAATDDKPPIALLGTDEGLTRVQTLLRRIEYGVLA